MIALIIGAKDSKIIMKTPRINKRQALRHAVWLQHTKRENGKDRWVMTVFDPEVKTVLDTGSSVLVLKQIRRMNLSIPEIMAGPACWDSEYAIKWS